LYHGEGTESRTLLETPSTRAYFESKPGTVPFNAASIQRVVVSGKRLTM
jgi:hypothetical protein